MVIFMLSMLLGVFFFLHSIRYQKKESVNMAWAVSLLGSSVEIGTSTEVLRAFEQHGNVVEDEPVTQRVNWCETSDKQLLAACLATQKQNVTSKITNWPLIAQYVTAQGPKSSKQCRERWHNHVNPDIDKSPFREVEDKQILSLFATLGSKWSRIADTLPGRTDGQIKNRYHILIARQRKESSLKVVKPMKSVPLTEKASRYKSSRKCLHRKTALAATSIQYCDTGRSVSFASVENAQRVPTTVNTTLHCTETIQICKDPSVKKWMTRTLFTGRYASFEAINKKLKHQRQRRKGSKYFSMSFRTIAPGV